MRFQVRETVDTRDPEMVLRVLEMCLRDVSTEVIRKPQQITFHGLGPSQRSVNPQDTTVMFVEVENNKTIIDAYVMYQASAVLGEIAQDEVVRQKLDEVFQHMKTQLDIEESWDTHFVAEDKGAALPVAEPEIETSEEQELEDVAALEAPQVLAMLEREQSDAGPEPESDLRQGKAAGGLPSFSRRAVVWTCAIAGMFLIIAAVFLLRWHYQNVSPRTVAPNSQPAPAPQGLSPGGNEKPTVTTAEQKAAAADSAPRSEMSYIDAADPRVWLQGWVTAMRTRDAVAQASFYADPVDQYMHLSNVSRDAVLREKQAAIADRRGLWTVRLEKVVIERPMGSEIEVRLMKHFIDQPAPSEIWERFVRTQLILKRVGGHWKITSEQDLP